MRVTLQMATMNSTAVQISDLEHPYLMITCSFSGLCTFLSPTGGLSPGLCKQALPLVVYTAPIVTNESLDTRKHSQRPHLAHVRIGSASSSTPDTVLHRIEMPRFRVLVRRRAVYLTQARADFETKAQPTHSSTRTPISPIFTPKSASASLTAEVKASLVAL